MSLASHFIQSTLPAVLQHTGGKGVSRYWTEFVVLIKKFHFLIEVLFQMCSVSSFPRVKLENTVSVEGELKVQNWAIASAVQAVLTQAAVRVPHIIQFFG